MAKTKKKMRADLKEMKEEELKKELVLSKENLRVLHFKTEGSKPKNVKEASTLKKHIARILTELNKNKEKHG